MKTEENFPFFSTFFSSLIFCSLLATVYFLLYFRASRSPWYACCNHLNMKKHRSNVTRSVADHVTMYLFVSSFSFTFSHNMHTSVAKSLKYSRVHREIPHETTAAYSIYCLFKSRKQQRWVDKKVTKKVSTVWGWVEWNEKKAHHLLHVDGRKCNCFPKITTVFTGDSIMFVELFFYEWIILNR